MTQWVEDRYLAGYEQTRIELPEGAVVPGEPGPLDAVLVRRNPPTHRRAMLYVHGWNDYFFQTHLADRMDALGFDFHAIDLRRYGRSLREGQVPGFITDLDDYSAELDAALTERMREHDSVTLMGHSTGGLIASLWADRRPGLLDGVILNSPWLDLQGSALRKAVTTPVMRRLGPGLATRVLPMPNNGLYNRAVFASLDGEWVVDESIKGGPGFQVRIGWLAAVMAGHARVAQGLSIDCPILVLTSARSDFRDEWDPALKSADGVLDVEQIARRAVQLGSHMTLVRFEGGMHDLALSAAPVREVLFDEIGRWARTYVV